MDAEIATGRLPNFATSQPASGSEIIRPTGKPRRTPPRLALSRCSRCWILGIREAQEEKQRPARKKNALTAIRLSRRAGSERGMFMRLIGDYAGKFRASRG